MEISILVERMNTSSPRFLAKTGQPWDASAEASTADEAVQSVQQIVRRRLDNGAKIILVPVESAGNPWLDACGILPDTPEINAWVDAMREYREKVNLEEATD